MNIDIKNPDSVIKIISGLKLPENNSHKGQNGKILIIGGSMLFHAASLWAAEVASHFCDMVHYSSVPENEKIFFTLKKIFRNGMVIPKSELDHYVREDDVILVGPGMVRDGKEGEYTRGLTERLINDFPDKNFVFDAGALQMMRPEWLIKLKKPAIITPHQHEFETLFKTDVSKTELEEKVKKAEENALKYKAVIMLKAVTDIITDGKTTYTVTGGNAGLTKGGTGDVLSGLTASFYSKNDPLLSAVAASVLLKSASASLFKTSGYWYNVSDIIDRLPAELVHLRLV